MAGFERRVPKNGAMRTLWAVLADKSCRGGRDRELGGK